MAQTSQPWDGTAIGDATRAPYSADEWDDMFEALFDSGRSGHEDMGVVAGYWNELLVAGVASPLGIDAGAALVHGKWYQNTTPATLAVPNPTVATRYDYVVLQCDWTAQTIRIALHQGVEGAGVPPALTQNDGVLWEIPLAVINTTILGVITVEDARKWVMSFHNQSKALSMGAALASGAGINQGNYYTWHNPVLQYDPASTGYASWQIDISDWDEYHPITVTFKCLNNTVGVGDGNPTVWELYSSQWPDHCDTSGAYAAGVTDVAAVAGAITRHVSEFSFTLTYADGFRRERILSLTLTRDHADPGDTSADTWVVVAGRVEYRA